MKDVRICYKENWRLRHWRSIHDAYKKAPFFEWYMDDIMAFFQTEPILLQDWNRQWFDWLLKQLRLNIAAEYTTEYRQDYGAEVEDLRGFVHPGNYLEFAEGLPNYIQVFSHRQPFSPNLSILDMLLCVGPNTTHLLWDNWVE
jgi:hypothetical protein